eukprot:31020-Eustigmatos_ZCMA.PRE.1
MEMLAEASHIGVATMLLSSPAVGLALGSEKVRGSSCSAWNHHVLKCVRHVSALVRLWFTSSTAVGAIA